MEEEMTEYVIKTKSDDGKFEHEFHVKMDVNYKGTIRHIKTKINGTSKEPVRYVRTGATCTFNSEEEFTERAELFMNDPSDKYDNQ